MDFAGEGPSWRFYTAKNIPGFSTVCVKLLQDIARADLVKLTALVEEAALMATLRHPSIVRVYGLVVDSKDVMVGW